MTNHHQDRQTSWASGQGLITALAVLAAATATGCPKSEELSPVEQAPSYSCGQAALFSFTHEQCAPMEAVGEGACRCAIGYIWDGADCTGIGGCECRGADCDSLTESYEECLEAHQGCLEEPPADPCAAMDAVGDGLCRQVLGYAWDGRQCQMLGGCECLGDDCEGLFETEATCLADREGCLPEPARTPCGGELDCDEATEVCVVHVARTPEFRCVPLPEGCDSDRSCGCAGEGLCDDTYELCNFDPSENTIFCECPSC